MVVTVDHQSLNVDPTGEDTWFLIVGEDPRYLTAGDADNVETIATAEEKRDNDIAKAWVQYNRDIGEAESDRMKLVARADVQRQDLVDEALEARNTLQETNQEILDDVFIAEGDREKTAALVITGTIVQEDTTPVVLNSTATTANNFNEYQIYVGTAQSHL